jgi:hypothetical protein
MNDLGCLQIDHDLRIYPSEHSSIHCISLTKALHNLETAPQAFSRFSFHGIGPHIFMSDNRPGPSTDLAVLEGKMDEMSGFELYIYMAAYFVHTQLRIDVYLRHVQGQAQISRIQPGIPTK